MMVIDPLAEMVRTILNIAINCMVAVVSGRRADAGDAQRTA